MGPIGSFSMLEIARSHRTYMWNVTIVSQSFGLSRLDFNAAAGLAVVRLAESRN
jgi:hypothetical protein